MSFFWKKCGKKLINDSPTPIFNAMVCKVEFGTGKPCMVREL